MQKPWYDGDTISGNATVTLTASAAAKSDGGATVESPRRRTVENFRMELNILFAIFNLLFSQKCELWEKYEGKEMEKKKNL